MGTIIILISLVKTIRTKMLSNLVEATQILSDLIPRQVDLREGFSTSALLVFGASQICAVGDWPTLL